MVLAYDAKDCRWVLAFIGHDSLELQLINDDDEFTGGVSAGALCWTFFDVTLSCASFLLHFPSFLLSFYHFELPAASEMCTKIHYPAMQT